MLHLQHPETMKMGFLPYRIGIFILTLFCWALFSSQGFRIVIAHETRETNENTFLFVSFRVFRGETFYCFDIHYSLPVQCTQTGLFDILLFISFIVAPCLCVMVSLIRKKYFL